jgi:hypothetical protein
MTSVAIENPALANQNVAMQVPARALSKALATGLHWKIVAVIEDMQ